MVVVNSGESYIGSEIREWCRASEDRAARIVWVKYYSGSIQPNDKTFYFVEKKGEQVFDYKVRRDLIKSPRMYSN